MTTKWSHLPNAAHIDAVIASVKANPDDWDAAYDAAYDAAWNAAYDAALDAAWDAAWDAARDAARYAARDAARYAAWNAALDAILALIAYDDCAHMLDSEPDDLRILSKLGSHAATLMMPASIAFKSIREKQVAVL
jgi:hypothetical protein